jgi:hypothetical protein
MERQNDRETLQLLLGHASAKQAVPDSAEGSSRVTPLVSGSAVSVSATLAPQRAVAQVGGWYSNSQLQGAMNARQHAVVDAARQHAESYSKSAAQKKELVEVQRLQALIGKKALFEDPAIQGSPLTDYKLTEMERFSFSSCMKRS